MKTAAALIRVSTSQQELDSQIQSLRIEAKQLGYIIPDELIFGEKITGWEDIDNNDRKSIEDLKNACLNDKHSKIKCIFCWELSRLSRKQAMLFKQIDWFSKRQKPIFFTSHNAWTLNPNTLEEDESGMMLITVLSRYGEQERNKIVQRNLRGKRFAVNENRYVGGSIPYGYDIEVIKDKKYYIIHNERSEIIKDIYDKYLYDGWASDRIARYLNQKNIPTYYNFNNPEKKLKTNIGRTIERKNIKWSHTAVLQILRNPFYKGVRSYQDLIIECPIIINPDVWEKVQKRLVDNNRFGEKKRKFNYPVKELLRCGECGSKFYGVVTSSKQLYYCNRLQLEGEKCVCNKLNKYRLDGIIWSFISNTPYIYEYFKQLHRHSTDANAIKELQDINDKDVTSIEDYKEKKKVFMRMFTDDSITESELNNEVKKINKYIKEIETTISERNLKIDILEQQQNINLAPEKIKENIISAGNDINKITHLINTLVKQITIYNLVEKRLTLLEVEFVLNRFDYKYYIIYDNTSKKKFFYYLDVQKFDIESRKFEMLKQLPQEEYIAKMKAALSDTPIPDEFELIDVYGMIQHPITEVIPFEYIEVNPFTIANPDYVVYKKKDNARRNELKKERKKKITKDYIKTPQEEYKYKVANIHNTRTKIRKMNITEEEKSRLLNETRIELDNIRNQYPNII